ncbi:hypothetical protein C8R43DRAFT_1141897 [Mycena crocata]|nr:hypothetical protein C8R43DRAFT_1141897 [Mycena crocata]
MPTTLPTTSLVADGGDDLDDDDCLSFVLTAAALPSSSATSSSKSALRRGSLGLDPDLVVSDSADSLGALSAESAHPAPQCITDALADPDGALQIRERAHFYGAHLATPARCFPRLNLPRRGSHAPIAICAVSGYRRCGALRIKARVRVSRVFVHFSCHTAATESIPKSRGYSGPSSTPPLENIPQRRFRYSWEFILEALKQRVFGSLPPLFYILDSIVIDWLLPRTPKSFTNVANANFRFELVSLVYNNKLILTLIRRLATLQNLLELHLWYLGSDSPVIHSKAGILCRKAATIFKSITDRWPEVFSNILGTPIGPPPVQTPGIRTGSCLGDTVTIANPDTIVIQVRQHLLKLSLNEPFNASQFSLYIDLKGFNMKAEPLVSFVDAALPYIESQDTETIVHLRQFIALQVSQTTSRFSIFVGWLYTNLLLL